MILEVLLDQSLNPRIVDVADLLLGAFEGGPALAAGERDCEQ
jgi:hypothetical protein